MESQSALTEIGTWKMDSCQARGIELFEVTADQPSSTLLTGNQMAIKPTFKSYSSPYVICIVFFKLSNCTEKKQPKNKPGKHSMPKGIPHQMYLKMLS